MDPGAQNPGVLITMGRVYEEVTATRADLQALTGDVRRALETDRDHEERIRRVEPMVPALQAAQKDIDELKTHIETKLEPRLSGVERWRWGAAGAIGAISMGGSALIGYLTAKH
jgi:hypothetical protein